ncbi:MAG: gluconate 2-dehydrogenase subunit 3 family protein [Gammaproteobacteria bacterium]|nr:gluconate 2-dehydrogenase subunit 3 family protein [Gammaproteobacteria bacterium]
MNSRRRFLNASALGVATITAAACAPAGTADRKPATVTARPLLTSQALQTLSHVCERLVPGASEGGVSVYVSQQLARDPTNNLLMLQYLGIAHAEHVGFYRAGLSGIEGASQFLFQKPCCSLSSSETDGLIKRLLADEFTDWSGAPSSFFLFVIRADACDVVYGTKKGFEHVGMPHMAHIAPTEEW